MKQSEVKFPFDEKSWTFDLKQLVVAGSTLEEAKKKADDIFYESVIKPLLANKDLVEELCNLPDKNQKLNHMLEIVQSAPEEEVPDAAFLDLVEYDYRFLFTPLGYAKLERWKAELRNADRKVSDEAVRKLREIGRRFAYKPKVKTLPHIKSFVALQRQINYEILRTEGVLKLLNRKNRVLRLRELFGKKIVEPIESELRYATQYHELADLITAAELGLSQEVVRTYSTKATQIKNEPAYINKK